jgi:hypothetical protein
MQESAHNSYKCPVCGKSKDISDSCCSECEAKSDDEVLEMLREIRRLICKVRCRIIKDMDELGPLPGDSNDLGNDGDAS